MLFITSIFTLYYISQILITIPRILNFTYFLSNKNNYNQSFDRRIHSSIKFWNTRRFDPVCYSFPLFGRIFDCFYPTSGLLHRFPSETARVLKHWRSKRLKVREYWRRLQHAPRVWPYKAWFYLSPRITFPPKDHRWISSCPLTFPVRSSRLTLSAEAVNNPS